MKRKTYLRKVKALSLQLHKQFNVKYTDWMPDEKLLNESALRAGGYKKLYMKVCNDYNRMMKYSCVEVVSK